MESLKNDLFERKKKTVIELDAEWRKKMKKHTAQLEEQQAQKCQTEKEKIKVEEKEVCIVKTQKLKEEHEINFSSHTTETTDLTEELKISMT